MPAYHNQLSRVISINAHPKLIVPNEAHAWHAKSLSQNYSIVMAGILFEDIFDVKDIDPDGKKFERGWNN